MSNTKTFENSKKQFLQQHKIPYVLYYLGILAFRNKHEEAVSYIRLWNPLAWLYIVIFFFALAIYKGVPTAYETVVEDIKNNPS